MTKRIAVAFLCTVATAVALSCARKTPRQTAGRPASTLSGASSDTATRDPRWATPIKRPGLPNLHKVSGALYRGAQPEAVGFAELKKLGVKTVVNLRLTHSDRDEMKEAGLIPGKDLNYVHIRMEAWDADEDEVVELLKVLADPANRPVFVHCKHGADRTGMAVATYRIICEGWAKADAIDEMRNGGFNFHAVWKGLPKFLREMDVEKLRADAGLGK